MLLAEHRVGLVIIDLNFSPALGNYFYIKAAARRVFQRRNSYAVRFLFVSLFPG
jgi:hypothetical protein